MTRLNYGIHIACEETTGQRDHTLIVELEDFTTKERRTMCNLMLYLPDLKNTLTTVLGKCAAEIDARKQTEEN